MRPLLLMAITLDISEAVEFSRQLRASAGTVPDTLAWGVELATRHLHGVQVQATPRGVTSITAASWHHSTTVVTSKVDGVVWNSQPSAWVLDQGSRAGPWRKMPPWSNEASGIGLWAKRRIGGPRARSIAFLIARKILQRGFTDRHRDFSYNAYRSSIPRLIQILDAAASRIADDMVQ